MENGEQQRAHEGREVSQQANPPAHPRRSSGRGGNAASLIEGVEGVGRAEAESVLEELVGGAGPERRRRVRWALE